jgi:metal-sulfur cluster biosynthetic enzyme
LRSHDCPLPPALSLDAIYARLDNVYDPELDESILKLGFVDEVRVDGGVVTVTYKLPTYWCAPNFAYMMSADVRDEVRQVHGVESVRVVLVEHCSGDEINAGVNQNRSFQETFPDEALDDLDDLRRKFLHKSFLARQEQLIQRLRRAGIRDERLVALRLADVEARGEDVLVRPDHECGGLPIANDLEPPSAICNLQPVLMPLAAGDLAKYLRKRARLGLPTHPGALLFTGLDGAPLAVETLPMYLRHSRIVRVSIAFNTSLCEGLLHARYDPERNKRIALEGEP